MELEHHQLDLRFAGLRRSDPKGYPRLLASLAKTGQQLPIVVVAADDADRPSEVGPHAGGSAVAIARYVVVDGYQRVRALRTLRVDTVRAMQWSLDAGQALLLVERMRSAVGASALEQGWLLAELCDRFGYSQELVAQLFDRSHSWVSRRLALVRALPEPIQARVRAGTLCPHAAASVLVPMARANSEDASRLAASISRLGLSTREVAQLYAGYQQSEASGRELLVQQPELYLRAAEASADPPPAPPVRAPLTRLCADLEALAGIARSALSRLRERAWLAKSPPPDRDHVKALLRHASHRLQRLATQIEKELADAR